MPLTRILWSNHPASVLASDQNLIQHWDRLNAEHGDLPFLSADVVNSALRILGNGQERLLVATRGSEVLALFLLTPTGKFQWQTFQPSQLPLGSWVCSAHENLVDMARGMLHGPLGFSLSVSITQVDPRIAPPQGDAPDLKQADYIDTGWIDIDGSFDDYWNARGKNLRQNMRKQRTKLAANGTHLKMQALRGHADMAAAIARYGSLESAGWKAEKGTAIHPDNAQGRFYLEMMEHASLRGEAVIYQYLFDDKVVAMNLCLERKGVLIVLKTTYDESIQNFSPAFLLREEELQEFHRDKKIKRLEYFGRLMDWHTKWTDQKRTLYHLTLYRWPVIKKLAAARSNRNKQGAAKVAPAGSAAHAGPAAQPAVTAPAAD
jgi:Acetyltransferase (GNAT) domain